MRNPTPAFAGAGGTLKDERVVHKAKTRSEKAAFGLIRALSFMTIAILVLIIGFILYKGFWYSNESRSATLGDAETDPEGVALVVGDSIELRSIGFPTLFGIYTDEYLNWGKISGDDFDLLPIAIDPNEPGGEASARLLFGSSAGDGAPWGGLVRMVPDAESALSLLRETPGAVALVPSEVARGAKGVRIVPIHRLMLAVNSEVVALVENTAIEALSDSAISRLLSGQVTSWKELGGPDLPVKLVVPPVATGLAKAARGVGFAPADDPSADLESYVAEIAANPGAVGPLYGSEVMVRELPTLTRKGVEAGWNLTFRYLIEEPRLSGKVGGISTIILNTLFMLVLTGLLAAPVGVAAAVYLVEYSRQGPLVRLLRLGTETLAGIPSIIFGLFGFLFFVNILHFGFGLLSGCLTLMIMILPTIVRTSEEALKAVPKSLREGSLALGATKLQTIVRVVIPAAASGILTGLILGAGRAVGETAALLFTMGSDYKLAKGLFSSARVLSSHIYLVFAEGISFDRAFSTAAILIVIVLTFNFAARRAIESLSASSRG